MSRDLDRGASRALDLDSLVGLVVVGDDGSPEAAHAIRWAGEEAVRRGRPLAVVRAWSMTTAPRPATFEPGYVPSQDEFADAVRERILTATRGALEGEPAVEVIAVPVHASARDALVAASEVAAVVVIGARGKGLAKALLGGTSEYVVAHARGPVTVVPVRKAG
ncbi:MAG TPA: universal stress protein [Actinomycetes bacterium]|nr:universal stress protein [Actinomycetes bacterium]